MNRLIAIRVFLPFFILCLLTGCLKEEYMPAEVGEQIPYDDELPEAPMTEVLGALPNTLFYQLWLKSSIASLVSNGADRYTVMVPDNAALESVGWTSAVISAATADAIDDFLKRYIFLGLMTEKNLQTKQDNYQMFSLHEYPEIYYEKSEVYTTEKYAPLRFQGYFALENSQLYMNGKAMNYSPPLLSKDGAVWPVNSTWELPMQTAWEYVKSNPDYSMYVGIMEYAESRYRSMFEEANGYGFEQHYFYTEYDPNLGYDLRPWSRPALGTFKVDVLNTFFVPTNTAFKKAGFADMDALLAFNDARKQPYTEWVIPQSQIGFYTVRGMFATDSLMDYHQRWGLNYADYFGYLATNRTRRFLNTVRTIGGNNDKFTIYSLISNPVLYGNKFATNFLMNMQIYQFNKIGTPETSVIDGGTVYYYPPFIAGWENGDSWLSIKGSDGTKVHIVDKDVTVLDGVVQGVDALLIPPGFSLD